MTILLWVLLQLSLATVTLHRITVTSRIDRISAYITDTHTDLDRRSQEALKQGAIFESIGCSRSVVFFDNPTITIPQVLRRIRAEDFCTSRISNESKPEFCAVLLQIIQNYEKKNVRQERSLERLTELLDMYRRILLTIDAKESVDEEYVPLLKIGSKYEFFERGVRCIPQVLHEVVSRPNSGQVFWEAQETSRVVRELVAEIMDEGEDTSKIRLCFERILGSKIMNSSNLNLLVKDILAPYKEELRGLGDELLNTEVAVLETHHTT